MGRIIQCVLYENHMSAFTEAYAEYLERMYEQSDELTLVDELTVPLHVNRDNPNLMEWADIG